MDFKQLESFVTIAKLKSFSRAADKLFLTQPTISNHIHLLEKELGTILFNRTNKNISLTEAGEILYEYAISILNKKEHAYFSLNEFKGKIEGILDISSSSIPELYYLTDLISKFSLKYPGVKYSLMKYDTRQVFDKIISGDIDFGIVGSMRDTNNLEYIEIMEDDIVLVGPTSGPLASQGDLNFEDLTNIPFVVREDGSGTRAAVVEYLNKHNIQFDQLNIIAEIENEETIKKLVQLGLGYTFMSHLSIERELQDGSLRLISVNSETISRKFYFVYHKKRVLSPLSETFKNFILGEKESN